MFLNRMTVCLWLLTDDWKTHRTSQMIELNDPELRFDCKFLCIQGGQSDVQDRWYHLQLSKIVE